jgi:hypothetical protein
MPQPLILLRESESNDCFLLAARVQDASGKDVDLSTYKGKVLLIVNVASQWYESSAAEPRVFLTFLLLSLFGPLQNCINKVVHVFYCLESFVPTGYIIVVLSVLTYFTVRRRHLLFTLCREHYSVHC